MKVMTKKKFSVIGIGYVGLPLAVALSRNNKIVGFDTNINRVKGLQKGNDITKEYYDSNVSESSGAARPASAPVADVVPEQPKPTTKKSTKKPDLSSKEEKMFEEFDDEWVEDDNGNFVPKK